MDKEYGLEQKDIPVVIFRIDVKITKDTIKKQGLHT
jgi:hypothetical protein